MSFETYEEHSFHCACEYRLYENFLGKQVCEVHLRILTLESSIFLNEKLIQDSESEKLGIRSIFLHVNFFDVFVIYYTLIFMTN